MLIFKRLNRSIILLSLLYCSQLQAIANALAAKNIEHAAQLFFPVFNFDEYLYYNKERIKELFDLTIQNSSVKFDAYDILFDQTEIVVKLHVEDYSITQTYHYKDNVISHNSVAINGFEKTFQEYSLLNSDYVKSKQALIVYKTIIQLGGEMVYEFYQDEMSTIESNKYSHEDLKLHFPVLNDRMLNELASHTRQPAISVYTEYLAFQRNMFEKINGTKTGLYGFWMIPEDSLTYVFDVVYCNIGIFQGRCVDYKINGNEGTFTFIFYDHYDRKLYSEPINYSIDPESNYLTIYFVKYKNEVKTAAPQCFSGDNEKELLFVSYSDESMIQWNCLKKTTNGPSQNQTK